MVRVKNVHFWRCTILFFFWDYHLSGLIWRSGWMPEKDLNSSVGLRTLMISLFWEKNVFCFDLSLCVRLLIPLSYLHSNVNLKPEMAYRKHDVSLNVHFLYQCHMVFAMVPPLQETRSSLEFHSYGRNECDHRLWIISPHCHQHTYWTHFSQNTYPWNFLTHKKHVFTEIKRKINFVGDLSLSQQHTLARSGNRCFLPCYATEINGHLNGLIGETMN